MNEDTMKKDVALAPFTTYKIGGPADLFLAVRSAKELADAVAWARQTRTPYFILGSGANILITDKGFRGLVIYNRADKVEFLESGLMRAESGALVADLIDMTLAKELSGLEHFVGIPSTVGGAIWQNLHFLSPDRKKTVFIESVVESATILDENNEVRIVGKEFFQFGYDDSILHHQPVVVLDVLFRLEPKPGAEIELVIKENMHWRTLKQPQLWAYPSCGSVFKKIDGAGAGRLIEQAGLKGVRMGGAMISPKHANYIVNTGGATARDVLDLIGLVQKTVKEKTGYFLETEIRVIGEQ